MRVRLGLTGVVLTVLLAAPAAHAYYSGPAIPGNPLSGHPWFVDTERGSWWVALRENPLAAAVLRPFAANPMGKSWGSWVAQPEIDVANYIAGAQASQPGSIPFFNLARIEFNSCPYPPTPAGYSEGAVDHWVRLFSQGIGSSRVLVIVETDKLAVINCLPRWARARRYREIRYEVHLLHRHNPNAILYIDAGSENWGRTAATMAGRLRRADVAEAQGFVLGASHHDWTYKEDAFGLRISRRLGGKHFLVNTDSNGWGPNPRWFHVGYHPGCTPPGEGLGYVPTVKTPDRHIDAYIWAGTPGFEEGRCLGFGRSAPYTFYLSLATSLSLFAQPSLASYLLPSGRLPGRRHPAGRQPAARHPAG